MENVASEVLDSPKGSKPLTKLSFLLRKGAKDLLSFKIFEFELIEYIGLRDVS